MTGTDTEARLSILENALFARDMQISALQQTAARHATLLDATEAYVSMLRLESRVLRNHLVSLESRLQVLQSASMQPPEEIPPNRTAAMPESE